MLVVNYGRIAQMEKRFENELEALFALAEQVDIGGYDLYQVRRMLPRLPEVVNTTKIGLSPAMYAREK